MIPLKQQQNFRRTLLAWYKKSQRSLPWRHTHDPYAILVSEMMLQQTQVDRVIPKFLEWMKFFSNTRVLAAAPRAQIIAQWQGLGYNRRALYLQRIAQTVERDLGGVFPQTLNGLLQLPGIGPYTAGAVMSFAYNAQEPIVDTNVKRVIGRVFLGFRKLQRVSDTALWNMATELLPNDTRTYFFNQSLMDFGAMICTARKPACAKCPMQKHCMSYPDILRATPQQLRVQKPANEKHYFGQPRRIWRGKILRYLHTPACAHSGATLRQIGRAIQTDFDSTRLPWIADVVRTLENDGFVMHAAKRIILTNL